MLTDNNTNVAYVIVIIRAPCSVLMYPRLNGVTGKKMRADFEATASTYVQNDARNLVEFCVCRYLVRSDADFHPSLSVNILSNPFRDLYVLPLLQLKKC